MRVVRKFNLARIGHQYETIDIEVEGETIEGCVDMINEAWKFYCKAIVDGAVQ
jgi:hypothetical protein